MYHPLFDKFILVLSCICILSVPVKAQVIPDNSAGTVVTPSVIKGLPSDRIDGGTIRGTNLFHSFQEFNVGTGRGVYFTNPVGIENILNRVTGNNPSNIMGTLGVLGNADLFIINPNGIVFGPNVSLDLNGSFLASTASNLELADGTEFSAANPQPAPLLTVSVPVGLGFTGSPGIIQVDGAGHTLAAANDVPSFTTGAGASTTGLRVKPETTIALVGGRVDFEGGIISAPSGKIEIGSVEAGQVKIAPDLQGFALDYTDAQNYQNIRLARLSLLDVSGIRGGDSFAVDIDTLKSALENLAAQPSECLSQRNGKIYSINTPNIGRNSSCSASKHAELDVEPPSSPEAVNLPSTRNIEYQASSVPPDLSPKLTGPGESGIKKTMNLPASEQHNLHQEKELIQAKPSSQSISEPFQAMSSVSKDSFENAVQLQLQFENVGFFRVSGFNHQELRWTGEIAEVLEESETRLKAIVEIFYQPV